MNAPNQKPNRNPRDPSQYNMYAAFRTKERAQAKKADAPTLYDVYRSRGRQQQPQAQQQTRRKPGSGAQAAPQSGQPRAAQTQQHQTQKHRQTAGQNTEPKRYGTRVQSAAGESGRYGFHSSYRTSDGRILDGFDKTGRPIYRDPFANADHSAGTSGVILHTGSSLQRGEVRLRPTRRVRIETLADTDTKPFPFRILFTVLLCTAMVMGILYTYMELNQYTTMLSSLSYRLSALKAEANTLSAEVVRREDLISIEQTASDVLGMVKTDVLTKKYVSIENEDKTEIVSKEQTENKKRIVTEIDLDSGKPIVKTPEKAASQTKQEQKPETTAESPVIETEKTAPVTESGTASES